jgi:hypothetical protein
MNWEIWVLSGGFSWGIGLDFDFGATDEAEPAATPVTTTSTSTQRLPEQ